MSVVVEQVDREAAADVLFRQSHGSIEGVRAWHAVKNGRDDGHHLVQALAHHRIAALEQAAKVADARAKHARDLMNDEIGVTDARVSFQLASETIATAIRSLAAIDHTAKHQL